MLALAERWGEVARIRDQASEGLAARRAGPPADRAALRAAASAFRRERHLLSGDDLRAWLAAHELTMEQWRGQLEGALLRDRPPATAPRRAAPPAPAGVGPAELEGAAFAEAVCTGALEAWAREAAARVALAPWPQRPRRRRMARARRPGARIAVVASPTSTRSTRWTAAPRAWPW